MTVSNQTSKNIYVGNGVNLIFAYTFRIFEDADLEVTIQDTSVTPQTEIVLVLNSDYTVSGEGVQTGGDVTLLLGGQLVAAPAATDNITIRRALPITQPTDYVENDPFPAESHEDALDRGAMIDQQLQEQVDRSLKLPANISGVDVTLPVPEPGAPIGWNDLGTGLVNNPDEANLSQVDPAALPDYIGATAGVGVIRTGSSITKTDGGDFVTLDTVQAIGPGSSPQFVAVNLTASLTLNGYTVLAILDEDNMISDRADALATQQSIKAYIDARIVAQNEFIELIDTPATYVGSGGRIVRVNPGATALVFGLESDINHDGLTNFVADEHVAHSSVTLTAGTGLSGGGDITANRSFAVNPAAVDHNSLQNYSANRHIDHTAVTITAGTGLSGGGDISANRTIDVDADYSVISANDANTDVTGSELEELTDGSSTTLHSHAGLGTDEKVKVDAAATADYIGAAFNDGVLHTASPLSYTDGGNFVTIGLDSSASFDSTGIWQFGRVEIDADTCYIDRDGSNNMTFTDAVTGTKTLAELASGGGGASLVEIVSQVGHGLVVGDWIKITGSGTYGKAQANNVANAECVGVVIAKPDNDNFTFQFGGKANIFAGLNPGQVYFLSDVTPGAITVTAPTTEGSVIKPVMIAETATEGFIFNMRGNTITSGGTSFYQSFVNADLVAGVLTVNHLLGHKFAVIQVYDNNDDLITPDNINLVDNNNADIDISSYGVIAGTWRVVVLDTGNVAATTNKHIKAFTNADLVAGVLTHLHNLGEQYVQVQVYNNNNKLVQPDDVTATSTTTSTIDLSSFGAIAGTWRSVVHN